MKRYFQARVWAVVALALLVGAVLAPVMVATSAFAQNEVPAADTPTTEPATSTPTSTPQPTNTVAPTNTIAPTASETAVGPTSTPSPTLTPVPRPVPIPEPVTVVLFGTGLAALSAAVATRRGKR